MEQKQKQPFQNNAYMGATAGIPFHHDLKNEVETNPHYMSSNPEDDSKWEAQDSFI